MANIFLQSQFLGPEDRLTASWQYVLQTVPGIGQAFLNHIATRAGLPRSAFEGAIDHPQGNRQGRPDFLLKCRDYDIYFEHKLDAGLGPDQLQRYLALLRSPREKLSLMAAQRISVDASVRSSRRFVFPRDSGAPPHFLWQDVHRIVARSRSPLALDFAKYLEELGLADFSWPGLGNPFTDLNAEEALRDLYLALTPRLRKPGVSPRTRVGSLIYEIRRPLPHIHLLNAGPLRSVSEWDPRIWEPVMDVRVWVKGTPNRRRARLPKVYGHLRKTRFQILAASDFIGYVYDSSVFLERYYYTPLRNILVRSKGASLENLDYFLTAILKNLAGEWPIVAD